jgi:hypothetical protein
MRMNFVKNKDLQGNGLHNYIKSGSHVELSLIVIFLQRIFINIKNRPN